MALGRYRQGRRSPTAEDEFCVLSRKRPLGSLAHLGQVDITADYRKLRPKEEAGDSADDRQALQVLQRRHIAHLCAAEGEGGQALQVLQRRHIAHLCAAEVEGGQALQVLKSLTSLALSGTKVSD